MHYLFISLVISFSIFNSSAYAKDKLVIALQQSEAPPYQWHNKQGELNGLMPDLFQKLFSELDYEVEFTEVDFFNPVQWAAMIERLNNGEIDFIGPSMLPPGGFPDLAVAKHPLLTIKMSFYFIKDKQFPILSVESLAGHKGVAVGAGMPEQNAEEQQADPNFDVKFVADANQAVEMLRTGQAEYWLTPGYVANGYIYSRDLRGQFDSSDFHLELLYYLLTAKEDSRQIILDKIDALIADKYNPEKIQRLRTYHLKNYVRYYDQTQ